MTLDDADVPPLLVFPPNVPPITDDEVEVLLMQLLPDITVVEEALFEALPPYITAVLDGLFNFLLPGTTFLLCKSPLQGARLYTLRG